MKKQVSILFATILATLPLANMAHAEGIYLKGGIGKSFVNEKTISDEGDTFKLKKHKDKLAYSVVAGLQLSPELSAEIDVRQRNFTVESKLLDVSLDTKTYSGTLNGVYQLAMGDLKPYVKAGVGVARHKLGESLDGGKVEATNKFAWNVGTGANYYLTDNMALNVDYQYQSLGKDKQIKFDMTGHEVLAGIRFDF